MDARKAPPPPNLLEQGVVINVAADNSCLDIQEGSVRKASFFKWRPKRDLLARVPHNCFDGEAHQSEQFGSTACVVESLGAHSDTHSDTSASSSDDDIDEDLLDLDWDNIPPVANLESDSHYEREDWDKEINESEACPYDAEDTVESISQQTGLDTPYCGQENTAYDPSCHHALPVTFSLPVRHYQRGQFDDADD